MSYKSHFLKSDIDINEMYSVHYFEFGKGYAFAGESHNFWELVYVDKGEIICISDFQEIKLEKGSVIFHKPGEWHSIHADGKTASNVVIVAFGCDSNIMDFFRNKVIKITNEQKHILSKIVLEYSRSFKTPLNEIYATTPKEKAGDPFGAQQLIRQYICEFLIKCVRGTENGLGDVLESDLLPEIKDLIEYMQNNINRGITIDELAKVSGSSSITVNRLFRKALGTTPINYFIGLKTELAKKYIRENVYNITEISEKLGYANVHYFSRQFKSITGMSPTEYGESVMAMTEIGKINPFYTE